MATLHKEIFVRAPSDAVWDAIRDVGALHTRLVPGFVIDCRMDDDTRVVTFGNGRVVREPILSIDDERRRLSWTATGGQLTHYNAVMEVVDEAGGCRVRWTSDLLPHALSDTIAAVQEQGLGVLKATMEKTHPPAG